MLYHYIYFKIYYWISIGRGIFVRYLQILLSLFMGLVLHLCGGKMFQANMFKKYVTNDIGIQLGLVYYIMCIR